MNRISELIKHNVVQACLWGVVVLTVVADWANDGIDILTYVAKVLGG